MEQQALLPLLAALGVAAAGTALVWATARRHRTATRARRTPSSPLALTCGHCGATYGRALKELPRATPAERALLARDYPGVAQGEVRLSACPQCNAELVVHTLQKQTRHLATVTTPDTRIHRCAECGQSLAQRGAVSCVRCGAATCRPCVARYARIHGSTGPLCPRCGRPAEATAEPTG